MKFPYCVGIKVKILSASLSCEQEYSFIIILTSNLVILNLVILNIIPRST